MNIEEIRLQKLNNGTEVKHHMSIRRGTHQEDIDLNEDGYKRIFQKIRPNNTFSTPDTMIQGFLQNTKTVPSFLNNNFFSNEEFTKILGPIKKELNHVVELNCPGALKKEKKYFKNNKTKKKKKPTKLDRIRKIYKKVKSKVPKSAKVKKKPKAVKRKSNKT